MHCSYNITGDYTCPNLTENFATPSRATASCPPSTDYDGMLFCNAKAGIMPQMSTLGCPEGTNFKEKWQLCMPTRNSFAPITPKIKTCPPGTKLDDNTSICYPIYGQKATFTCPPEQPNYDGVLFCNN